MTGLPGTTSLFVVSRLLPPEAMLNPLIGSSGIVYGVLTAYAIGFPNDEIQV